MNEIVYGDNKELVNLTGKSIAEAREFYRAEFGIPDSAEAVLNGKAYTKKLESRVKIEDYDEICFVEKGRSRVPLLITALLLALAVSAGAFAYTYTTASATLSLTSATNDFASVTSNSTGVSAVTWQPFGRFRGTIPAGTLFNVTPTTGYPGDLEVKVYLSNMDELTNNYSFMMFRLELWNSSNVSVDAEGITQLLTLENGVASFYFPSTNFTAGTTYYVRNRGGSYIAFPWAASWTSTYSPVLYTQVTQGG